MEERTELQGWELLPRVDPPSSDEDGGDPFGLFKADYFVLDSGDHGKGSGGLEEKGGLSELDDQKLMASDGTDSVKETDLSGDGLERKGMVLEGAACSDEAGDLSWLDSWGDEIESVAGGGVRQVEAKGEVKGESGPVSPPKPSDRSEDSSRGDSGLVGRSDGAEGKAGVVWWKVPLEIVKYFVFRVRPVWSISIAAAVVGLLMVSRRLFRMRRAGRRIPIAVSLDDHKKALHIPAAARLNEAFVLLRRVPAIKASLPTSGVTPWPAIALS